MRGAVTVTALRKSFGPVTVLDGVDLHVPPGSVCALLGPNGAGKTTVVRILSTLLRPDGGHAEVDGHDVVTQAHEVRRSIGLTGQYAAVDELLTGLENLLLMGRLARLDRTTRQERAAELLDRFDLTDARDRRVGTYSGGMRRRLDLAASLMSRPAVLFLDEPTTGLDPRSRQTMWQLVRDLAGAGVTIVLTTQYLEEADQLADRVAVLDHGRIVAEGTAEELKARVGGERVELSFADDEALSRARHALAPAFAGAVGPVAGHPPERAVEDAARRSLAIGTDGTPAALKGLLDLLATADIPVRRVSLRRPTLDDVFLTMTGGEGR